MMREDSFATAYQNGFRATIRLMLSKGLFLDEAEEFAQAAWVRGWECRQQLKSDDKVVQWVNAIAINTMHNEQRRSRRYEELDEIRRPHATLPPPVAAKIDLDKMLMQCSSLDRSLILHRYTGGLEMEEIARLHGLTCIAARVRLHRARAAIRRYVKPEPRAAAVCLLSTVTFVGVLTNPLARELQEVRLVACSLGQSQSQLGREK